MLKKLFFLALLGFALAVSFPASRGEIEERARPVLDRFRAKLVPRRLEAMADQLEVRIGRGQSFPPNWEAWLEREYSAPARDPWDRYYYLDAGRRDFTVGSLGPDGARNTPDDVRVTRTLGR